MGRAEMVSEIYIRPLFFTPIRNTLVLSGLNLLFGFTAPILFALLLDQLRHQKFKKFVQTASYMPYFISTVVVAGMVISFIDVDGLITNVLVHFGMAGQKLSCGARRISLGVYHNKCVEGLWICEYTLLLHYFIHRPGAL